MSVSDVNRPARKVDALVAAVRSLDEAQSLCDDADERGDILKLYEQAKALLPDHARPWISKVHPRPQWR